MIKNRLICVAPMMDWTDRHCRYFHRLLHADALLYTEMIHANAVIAGDRDRLLGFASAEHPVAVQLGGNDPLLLAQAARICASFGYDEINLNVGCPSDRVQTGQFGACLMAQPELVAECVASMKKAVDIPVTVKTRIGIDDHDSYEFLQNFMIHIVQAGVDAVILHARKALLSGLSPKQNREIPPLNYRRVERIAGQFSNVPLVLNGGITSLQQIEDALGKYSGVMLGRAAYQNPWLLARAARMQGLDHPDDRAAVVRQYARYVASELRRKVQLQSMARHVLGLFQGQPGARKWRRYLSENCHLSDKDESVLLEALELVDQQPLITYK